MADAQLIINKLGDQIKQQTIIIAMLQADLEEHQTASEILEQKIAQFENQE